MNVTEEIWKILDILKNKSKKYKVFLGHLFEKDFNILAKDNVNYNQKPRY